jgi:hypothetical protein
MKDITERQHRGTIQPPSSSRKCRNPKRTRLGRVRNRLWFPRLARLMAKHTPGWACVRKRRIVRTWLVVRIRIGSERRCSSRLLSARRSRRPQRGPCFRVQNKIRTWGERIVPAPVCVWIRPPPLRCVLRGEGARVVSAIAASDVCSARANGAIARSGQRFDAERERRRRCMTSKRVASALQGCCDRVDRYGTNLD